MTRTVDPTTARATSPLVWVALGAVYVVWGTTYFAIRVVNETLPPLLAAGTRFMLAGAVMYTFAVRRGDREGDRPGRRQWRAAGIVGGALQSKAKERMGSTASTLQPSAPRWPAGAPLLK